MSTEVKPFHPWINGGSTETTVYPFGLWHDRDDEEPGEPEPVAKIPPAVLMASNVGM